MWYSAGSRSGVVWHRQQEQCGIVWHRQANRTYDMSLHYNAREAITRVGGVCYNMGEV